MLFILLFLSWVLPDLYPYFGPLLLSVVFQPFVSLVETPHLNPYLTYNAQTVALEFTSYLGDGILPHYPYSFPIDLVTLHYPIFPQ